MALRHIVLLTLDDACDVDGLVAALGALPAAIPEIRSYEVALDAGLADGNAGLSVVATFDDEAGWATYRDHPSHVAVIAERIKPHLVGRSATQHYTGA